MAVQSGNAASIISSSQHAEELETVLLLIVDKLFIKLYYIVKKQKLY